jgi:hypothetical protein
MSIPMRSIHDPNHPIWDFGRYAILIAAATAILYANASDFDITEVKSITAIAGSMAILAGLERHVRNYASKKETSAEE